MPFIDAAAEAAGAAGVPNRDRTAIWAEIVAASETIPAQIA
jgi:hypothetical protein